MLEGHQLAVARQDAVQQAFLLAWRQLPRLRDPERFSPERAEDQRRAYSLIGFGAGLYKCPGANFGTYEMALVLSLMLLHYELELVNPNPARDFEMGVIRPRPPCVVRYRRRTASSRRAGGHLYHPEKKRVLCDAAARTGGPLCQSVRHQPASPYFIGEENSDEHKSGTG